jgi:hypothetical protein
MVETQNVASHRLLISYPWISKEERDFAYLVNQLKAANIEATYDSYQILPGRHLWQRIEQRLSSIGFDGWLYILTHQCFTGGMFANTLSTAIDQTTQRLSPEMPVAGLMYGVAAQNVPPALRGRPCISLGDPAWRQQLSEILERRSRQNKGTAAQIETRFVWRIHPNYGNNPSMTAVEVRARHESVEYWRFAVPKPARPVFWGQGTAGGGEISRIRFEETKGYGRYGKREVTWFGAANIVSNTESAYAVFSGPLPDFICFGPARDPFGPPEKMEILWTNFSR